MEEGSSFTKDANHLCFAEDEVSMLHVHYVKQICEILKVCTITNRSSFCWIKLCKLLMIS